MNLAQIIAALERDRREPDKVLLNLASLRRWLSDTEMDLRDADGFVALRHEVDLTCDQIADALNFPYNPTAEEATA